MSENPEISDVTMTGSVSIDMLDNLLVCLNNYKGPLSITLHINDDNNLQLNLDTVKSFLNNNFAVLKKQLDLHLIIDNFPHQHNYFANVAAFFSRTDLILPMDFNFILSTDFSLNKYEGVLSKLMDQNNKVLYIIPSFEKVQSENAWELTSQFPHSKKGLMEENRYQIYGGSDNRAHISTNYSEWYLANNPYLTASISFFYEPFAVFNKHVVPWMDERFIGSNGGGRSAWFYEITLSGFEFWVLNDDFLIFSNTPTSLANELKNKTFWGFLPEICNRHRVRLWESEKKEIDLMGCRPGPNSRF
ncbi:hypothetical protein HDU92_002951 [Lobulomyces angularis]|nr:hypothetical protein HDU92_002951 [Lobulomyces angularis]